MSYSQSGYVMEHNDYDIMIMIIGGGNFYVNNLCLFFKAFKLGCGVETICE